MSCVIGTVTNKYAIVTADKRFVFDNGEVDDNFSSIFKINAETILALVGAPEGPEQFETHGYMESDLIAKDYFEELYVDLLLEKRFPLDTNVIVFGKEEEGGFGAFFNPAYESSEQAFFVEDDRAVWTPLLPPADVDGDALADSVREETLAIIEENPRVADQIEKISAYHKAVIEELAETNETVNNQMESFIVEF